MQRFQDFEVLLTKILEEQELLASSLSKLRKKGDASYGKVSVRPVDLKGIRHYQIVYHYPNKELHENLSIQEAKNQAGQFLYTAGGLASLGEQKRCG